MMVDTLTKSGCSRYVEFKAINKVCVYQSGKVEQVGKINAVKTKIRFFFFY